MTRRVFVPSDGKGKPRIKTNGGGAANTSAVLTQRSLQPRGGLA